MYEEIARTAAPICLPLPPLKKLFGVERDFRRGSQETRPIACFRGGIQRNGIVPSANGGIAIPACGHHIQLTNCAGCQQLFRLCIYHRAYALTADLNDSVCR